MKNVDLLPISAEAQKRLSAFALQYRRMARIYVEVVSFKDQRLIVRAEQKEAVNDKVLTKSELVERVRDMFAGEIPGDWKLTVSAVNFDPRDISVVDAAWIRKQMDRLGLKAKDVVKHMGLTKSEVSLFVAGERPISRLGKSAFYYFFKYYEMSNFTRE